MTIISEEKVKELISAWVKVPSVNSSCIWCSACVAISPDVFELNDEWMSEVKELSSYEDLWVDDSIMACPVDAISWNN